MLGELILQFILYCCTSINKCLLPQDVAGDVEDLCDIHALKEKKMGERVRERFHTTACVEGMIS